LSWNGKLDQTTTNNSSDKTEIIYKFEIYNEHGARRINFDIM